MHRSLLALVALLVVSCSSKTASDDTGAVTPGKDAGTILGGGDAAPTGPTECADSTKLIYVISDEKTLYRFQPLTVTFDPVGIVRCTAGATPTSMAVDRYGTAWVRHTDGTVWKVSTKDASCAATTFDDASVFLKFGMGFSTDGATGSKETLFLSDSNGGGLGAFDTTTLKFKAVGKYDGALAGRAAELTGTGDGRLFGFFTTDPAQIGEIDKTNGHIRSSVPLANTTAGGRVGLLVLRRRLLRLHGERGRRPAAKPEGHHRHALPPLRQVRHGAEGWHRLPHRGRGRLHLRAAGPAEVSPPDARARFAPKPPWLKVKAPGGPTYTALKEMFRAKDLHTVCEEARCPNVGECWAEGTATVMLLGDTCTRGCRFCAVTTGNPRGAVDGREPEHVARSIASLDLKYVVLTMVDRDDLLDGGASHVARTVSRLKELRPELLVETLLGDFGGHTAYVDVTVDAQPDVWAHNIEVVRRLQRPIRDVRCSYETSLAVLRHVKQRDPTRATKSSIMVGIGETDDEIVETLADLRAVGVDIVTLGQYLRPTPRHAPVDRYVEPALFDRWQAEAMRIGFRYCASGPLVRSSYRAAEVFVQSLLRPTARTAAPLEGDLVPARSLVRPRSAP